MNPWSLFWRQGHSTTFGDYFKQGYEGAVANWWQSRLSGLSGQPVVMEVGCGNCSLLPAMAKTAIEGKYIGVDIAKVQLSNIAKAALAESNIELLLHSETPAEDIPEADDSVTLLASVFGIEYSNLDQSLPEVLRLLEPGGQFCAFLHHNNSIVTTMSRRAISEYSQSDIEDAINALTNISSERDRVRSISELKNSQKAEKGRKRINSLAEKYLSDTNPNTANATMFEFMNDALKFFKMMGANSQDRQKFISSLQAEHTASHERFKQMVSVAFDESGIEKVKSELAGLGFENIETSVAYTNKDITAWELSAFKPRLD